MVPGGEERVKLSVAKVPGVGSFTVTVEGPDAAPVATAKLAATVPSVFMVQLGRVMMLSESVKSQARGEVPFRNPPPIMVTFPSSVPNPPGADIGVIFIVGILTTWNVVKLAEKPLLGVTVRV